MAASKIFWQTPTQLKGKLKEKVENSAERGILSKKLATIICDVPVEFHQEQYDLDIPDFEKVGEIFRRNMNSEDCMKICTEHFMSNQLISNQQ